MSLRILSFFMILLSLEAFAEAPPADRSPEAFITYYNGLSRSAKQRFLTESFDRRLFERQFEHLAPEDVRKLNHKLEDSAIGDASTLRSGIYGGMRFANDSMGLLSNVDRHLFNLAYLHWSNNFEWYYQTTLNECESDLNLVQQHIDQSASFPLLRNAVQVVARNSSDDLYYPIMSLRVRALEGQCLNRQYINWWGDQESSGGSSCATRTAGSPPCPTEEEMSREFNQSQGCKTARSAVRCVLSLAHRLSSIQSVESLEGSGSSNANVNSTDRSAVKDAPSSSPSSPQRQGSVRH